MVVNNMKVLTNKQRLILEYIEYMLSIKGFPPTLKEIANFLGIKNTSVVYRHLKRIEKKGYIKLTGGTRGVVLIKPLRGGKLVPLYRELPLTAGLLPQSRPKTYEMIEVPEWIYEKLGNNPVAVVWQWKDCDDAFVKRGDVLFISPELPDGYSGFAIFYHPETGISMRYVKVTNSEILLSNGSTDLPEKPVLIGRVVLTFRDMSKL